MLSLSLSVSLHKLPGQLDFCSFVLPCKVVAKTIVLLLEGLKFDEMKFIDALSS